MTQNKKQSATNTGRLQKITSIIDKSTSDSDQGSINQVGSLEISPEDQLKIIQETGILDKLQTPSSLDRKVDSSSRKPLIEFSTHELQSFKKITSQLSNHEKQGEEAEEQEEEHSSPDTLPLWVDRAFDTFLWSIPFNTVFICLDVMIHAQYGQPVTFTSELNRLKNVYPSSLFIIYYSIHYPEQILSQLLLFGLSTIGGSYMIYAMNKLSYLLVIKQVPSLGALWMFSVVRMQLAQCLFSLFLVFLWCWIMNLSLYV